MRGSRSLLVLLVVALGLGAYIYFVESERDLTDPELKKDKVFAVETGTIEEIQITTPTREVTTLQKKGDEWQVVAPVTAPADEAAVSSVVSTLETLEVQKPLDDAPASMTPFGLDPPHVSVSFRVAGETAMRRLNLGSKTPTGSDLYARIEGQPRLFLVSSYIEDNFNKSTFDLRDKTVLTVTRDAVDSISLEPAGGTPVTLSRTGSDWRLKAPLEARADTAPVDEILNRTSQAQMKAIVAGDTSAPTPAELRTYGLDRPRLVVRLGAGSSSAALAIGAKKDDSTVYARDLSKPLVFTVDASLLTDLDKKPADLRVKDLFAFKSFSAAGLDITLAGQTWSFAKVPPAEGSESSGDVWKMTRPEAKDVNQTAFVDLLNGLSVLKAEQFDANPPGGADDMVVAARYGDATAPQEETVRFRRRGSVVEALRNGEPGGAVIPTTEYDKIVAQLKDITSGK